MKVINSNESCGDIDYDEDDIDIGNRTFEDLMNEIAQSLQALDTTTECIDVNVPSQYAFMSITTSSSLYH